MQLTGDMFAMFINDKLQLLVEYNSTQNESSRV